MRRLGTILWNCSKKDMQRFLTPSFLLRAGLAFAFVYAAVGAFVNPSAWLGFFPPFLVDAFPQTALLWGFGIGEIALATWLLSGFHHRIAGALSAVMLFGIVVFNTGQMDVVFRDISLALAALALMQTE